MGQEGHLPDIHSTTHHMYAYQILNVMQRGKHPIPFQVGKHVPPPFLMSLSITVTEVSDPALFGCTVLQGPDGLMCLSSQAVELIYSNEYGKSYVKPLECFRKKKVDS